jgi:hypothetical protein
MKEMQSIVDKNFRSFVTMMLQDTPAVLIRIENADVFGHIQNSAENSRLSICLQMF